MDVGRRRGEGNLGGGGGSILYRTQIYFRFMFDISYFIVVVLFVSLGRACWLFRLCISLLRFMATHVPVVGEDEPAGDGSSSIVLFGFHDLETSWHVTH